MPRKPKDVLPQGKRPARSKFAEPLAGKPAKARTNGGRLVYAGADFDEHKVLRAQWEGAGK